METLKKIVNSQYFPAAAVLAAVLLFWAVGLLGGLSLLHNNQPPLTTLAWMLFVYGAAVLTPLAGALAAADLLRRWRRNKDAAAADEAASSAGEAVAAGEAEPSGFAPAEPSAGDTAAPAPAPAEPSVAKPAGGKNGKQPGRKQAA
ncbi:hypothetical protein FDW83_14215 [Pseudarthrobacter sp. NamE2]|uniref:hypothetical protein n=1 Tax=Pseudarthrobacter sp. NamE2 TaxID=2576838 RepID=UPI0010FD0E67|nr:hypothetical protein [Pseudarthrobacter sp. NamE2]TLM81887.1 hypothetical protein FDW83_14215 [Pseudarthrobacter sp. NamE2]